MNPSELMSTEVRYELEKLIESYPFRTGSVQVVDEGIDIETTCVYYTDENDRPVNVSVYNSQDVTLKTPVCIVGQWIEEFHPEFKEHPMVNEMLLKNSTIKHASRGVFPDGVYQLLVTAQDQQDNDITWGNIDLDQKLDSW